MQTSLDFRHNDLFFVFFTFCKSRSRVCVVESITQLEFCELEANNTRVKRTKLTVSKRRLANSCRKRIDVAKNTKKMSQIYSFYEYLEITETTVSIFTFQLARLGFHTDL